MKLVRKRCYQSNRSGSPAFLETQLIFLDTLLNILVGTQNGEIPFDG